MSVCIPAILTRATGVLALTLAMGHAWPLAAVVDPAPDRVVAPEYPPSPAWAGSDRHSLATDANGHVVLSWLEPVGGAFRAFRFATLVGARWSLARTIADSDDWTDTDGDVPRLAPQTDGTLLAHWLLNRGLPGDHLLALRVLRSHDGTQWYEAYRGRPETGARWPRFVSLFRDRGDATGVYLQEDAGRRRLAVDTFGLASRRSPEVAPLEVDSCGRINAVTSGRTSWTAYRQPARESIAAVRWSDRGWSAPIPVFAGRSARDDCDAPAPSVAVAGSTVAVAWVATDATASTLRMAATHDADAFEPPLFLEPADPRVQPAVAVLTDGRIAVSWVEPAASGARLALRLVRADGRPGLKLSLAALPGAEGVGALQMVAAEDGLVIAWRDTRVQTALVPWRLLIRA